MDGSSGTILLAMNAVTGPHVFLDLRGFALHQASAKHSLPVRSGGLNGPSLSRKGSWLDAVSAGFTGW